MRTRWTAPAVMILAAAACGESPAQPSDPAVHASVTSLEARGLGSAGGLLAHREALGLTDAQVAEIRGILAELREINAPLMEQLRPAEGDRGRRMDPAKRALFEQMRANTNAAQERIQAALSAEQRAKLAELRPARLEGRPEVGRRGRRPGVGGFGQRGGAAAGLLHLREQLGLTEDQVASLSTIQEELMAKNQPLLEQLRASGERPARDNPIVQQLQANAKSAMEQTRAVLTAEQQAELDELRPRGRQRPAHMAR